MKLENQRLVTLLAAACFATTACGQQAETQTSKQDEPSAAEVMSSPEVQQAMAGAMQMLRQMDANQAGAADKPATGDDAATSDAMRDATSVLHQTIGFSQANPNATDAERQAAANRMMQGIFQRELNGTTKVSTLPQGSSQEPSEQGKDYGDYDGDA